MSRVLVAALVVGALVACRTVTAAAKLPDGSLGSFAAQHCEALGQLDAGASVSQPREVDGCVYRCERGRFELQVLDGGTCLEPLPAEVATELASMLHLDLCHRDPERTHEWDEGSCHVTCLGTSMSYSDRADAGARCDQRNPVRRIGDFRPFGPPWDDGAR